MDGSASDIAMILGGLGGAAAAVIASWRGVKKPHEEAPPAMVAGSIFSGADLARLGDWLAAVRNSIDRSREQQHDDSRELRQAIERQSTAIERNTEAVSEGAVTPRELAQMLARLDRISRGQTE